MIPQVSGSLYGWVFYSQNYGGIEILPCTKNNRINSTCKNPITWLGEGEPKLIGKLFKAQEKQCLSKIKLAIIDHFNIFALKCTGDSAICF